jgi:NAD(P)-dependent dehydrogenase (short-subunit alcohol dehydrogenase family)
VLETLRLDGKTAVFTGAGRGLGQAMAKALAQAGAELVCAARTVEQIDQTVREITEAGGRGGSCKWADLSARWRFNSTFVAIAIYKEQV